MPRKNLRVAIIGGSLVGPATELMFRQAGYDEVTTYEASRIIHPQSGGVMGLRPESLKILRSVQVPTADLVALTNRDVISYDLTGPTPDHDGHFGVSLRRHDLFPGDVTSWDALHATLARRVDIRHQKRVTAITDTGVAFADGTTAKADLVVFADGRKSTGRALLDPARRLRYMGYMVWRGLAPQPPGRTAVRGFHRYYDTPHGVLFSVTEPILQTGDTYWEFSHNLDPGTFRLLAGGPPTERPFLLPDRLGWRAAELRGAYAEAHLPEEFAALIGATTNVMGIPINDTPTPQRAVFRVGATRAVLIGDALQSVRLQAGAGLNGGLLQANSLIYWLGDTDVPLDTILASWQEHALREYLPWVELGRVRADRTGLGSYLPVRPGYTVPPTAPSGNVWDTPRWTETTKEIAA